MKGLMTLIIVMIFSQAMIAQVYYGIDLSADKTTYTVSLKSDADIPSPLNMTSTAQVTIKFPTNANVQMDNLTPLQPLTSWNKTVRINQPTEAMDYDYITFGLASLGTTGLTFEQDSILPLFSFENIGSDCAGLVELIDNQTDAFLYPNSEHLSIKNQISVWGMGGNAYAGNYQGSIDCQSIVSTTPVTDNASSLAVFPNPALDFINVDYTINTNEDAQLILTDALGRRLMTRQLNVNQDLIQLDITKLVGGTYFIQIQSETYLSKTQSFVKVGRE